MVLEKLWNEYSQNSKMEMELVKIVNSYRFQFVEIRNKIAMPYIFIKVNHLTNCKFLSFWLLSFRWISNTDSWAAADNSCSSILYNVYNQLTLFLKLNRYEIQYEIINNNNFNSFNNFKPNERNNKASETIVLVQR